jgi:hypothetical protein
LSGIEIVPAEDAKTQREFLRLPYRLYRGDPRWVPPLLAAQKELFDCKKHPFHRHATMRRFLARRDGRTVGRIAAILDPNHNEFHGEQAGFFGFLEMIDDGEVARALLGAARAWLFEHGAQLVRGPVNPSTNYECGLLVDGFDSSPMVMMTYNPPYYARLLEEAGLAKAMDLLAYAVPATRVQVARVEALAERARKSGMRIRQVRLGDFASEVDLVWQVYNSAWRKNWGFVPMPRAEFFHIATELKRILVPEMALFAEKNGNVAGFALAVPDINQALRHAGGRLFPFGLLKLLWHKRRIRRMRVILLGVVEQSRAAPVAAALYSELIRAGFRLGYLEAECSWVLENNVLMRRSIESLGGRVSKTYRIYEWK